MRRLTLTPAEFRRWYQTHSLFQIGQAFGVSWQAAQRYAKRHGIALRSRGGDFRRFPRMT